MWKDLKKTAIVFTAGNLFFIGLLYMNLVTLVLLFALFVSLSGVFMNAIGKFLNSENSEDQSNKDDVQYEFVSADTIQSLIVHTYVFVNSKLDQFRSVIVDKKYAQFCGILISLAFLMEISSCFSDFTLFWLAYVIVFTVPFGYNSQKDLIDSQLQNALAQTKQIINQKVLKAIPRYSDLKKD